jgi:hypothetical protein
MMHGRSVLAFGGNHKINSARYDEYIALSVSSDGFRLLARQRARHEHVIRRFSVCI